jgi:hypothetical protein
MSGIASNSVVKQPCSIEPPTIETSRGSFAQKRIVCPGDDLATLYPNRIALHGVTRCKLQMMRLADPGYWLPAAVMSDLGLARYAGYAALPEATCAAAPARSISATRSTTGTSDRGAKCRRHACTAIHTTMQRRPIRSLRERVDEIILEEFSAVRRLAARAGALDRHLCLGP